jgi:hypothetical protein
LVIDFGLKTISEHPEIIIKSRKNTPKAQKSLEKLLEMIWNTRNLNIIIGSCEKYFRAFY